MSGVHERQVLNQLNSGHDPYHAIRCHWHVGNSLHWVMDVTFGKDHSL